MEKINEFMGKVVKVEETEERNEKYIRTGKIIRVVTVELPQIDAYVSNSIKMRSDVLKMGDAVRIVALSVPALTASEIETVVSQ